MLQRTRFYNYFDVDDIAAKETLVPVTFLVPAFTLASEVALTHQHRDPDNDGEREGEAPDTPAETAAWSRQSTSSENSRQRKHRAAQMDVRRGQRANMPLWAVLQLHRKGFLRVHVPPMFDLSAFVEFKTEPLTASLSHKSPYFYEVGMIVAQLIETHLALNTAASSSSSTSTVPMSPAGKRLMRQLIRLYQVRYFNIVKATQKTGRDQTEIREKLVESERFLMDANNMEKEAFRLWYNSSL